jgi:hypothetical protein
MQAMTTQTTMRNVKVGDLLPDAALGPRPARRIDATALVIPGSGGLDRYLARLEAAADDFAAWDGRVTSLPPDEASSHRIVVVDRYGQVYAAFDGDEGELPDAAALEEWFRFLATACPECGVIDDPRGRGWVP